MGADLSPEKIAELRARAERAVREANPEYLIGVDEVGFGPVAGPLVIGAVGVPVNWVPPVGLTDSKKLSRNQIDKLVRMFMSSDLTNVHYKLVWTSSEDIDRCGLGRMRRESLSKGIQTIRDSYPANARTFAIVDGNLNIPKSFSTPKADLICPVVSMAAVIAKFMRDNWMVEISSKYPGYGFEDHVGYDTKGHREAIRKLGACPIHRMSTRTLKDLSPNGLCLNSRLPDKSSGCPRNPFSVRGRAGRSPPQ